METKVCSKCDKSLPLTSFTRDRYRVDGFHRECKICKRKRENARRDLYRKQLNARNRKRAREYRKEFCKFKETLSCKKCGENEVCCLDFHHLDPNEKEFGIAHASQRMSLERLMEEVKKCLVVCKNCHTKIHAGIIQI